MRAWLRAIVWVSVGTPLMFVDLACRTYAIWRKQQEK